MVKQIHLIIKAIKSNVNNTHASRACTFSLSLKRTHTQTLAHRHFLSLPPSLSCTRTQTQKQTNKPFGWKMTARIFLLSFFIQKVCSFASVFVCVRKREREGEKVPVCECLSECAFKGERKYACVWGVCVIDITCLCFDYYNHLIYHFRSPFLLNFFLL